jgi:outer membrane murein-binding lipoprotein Lpp
MKLIKLLSIIGSLSLITACANMSDIENLQAQIDLLKPKIITLSSDINATKTMATEAGLKSAAAENLANRAAQYAQEMSSKLDYVPCRIPRPKNKK